jgi:hypothetical protein
MEEHSNQSLSIVTELLDFESGSSAELFIDGLDSVESKSDLDG